MAKTKTKAASTGGNRRDRLASFEAARKSEQRRRNLGMLAICLVLALALLAYPLYLFVEDYRDRNTSISDIGANLADAGCSPAATNAASGNQEHVPDGTKVPYGQAPPDSGPHYASPAPFTKRFYTIDDRPPVETLVHNLEHGYLVAWYRDGLGEDQVEQLDRIAGTFDSETYDPTQKFIAAPWSEADGAGFPAGKNVVLTHWYADPANPTDAAAQRGVRQECTAVSGAAIADFMTKYPATASPEPNAA